MNYALIAYPLSSAYRENLEATIACSPHYLSIADLRRLPILALFGKLRAMRNARVLIPMEDANGLTLLPILACIAAFSAAKSIQIIHPDSRLEPFPRWRAVGSMFQIVTASIASALSALLCRAELYVLSRQARAAITTKPGRVLYLKTNLWFGIKAGGSVGHIAGVINSMVEAGNEVHFASAEPAVMLKESVRFLPLTTLKRYGLPAELNLYRFQRHVVNQISEGRDVSFIYQRMSIANYAGVVLSRRWRVPLVLEYNGSEAWIARNWGKALKFHELAVRAEEVCLKHAHLIVTVSAVLRDELIARGVDSTRIVCYPNCIDPAVFSADRFTQHDLTALRERYDISPTAVVVTFIGTFGQWHGAEVLAQAIHEFCESERAWLDNHQVIFLFIGDGQRLPVVKEKLQSHTGTYVRFSGLIPQPEAPAMLAMSDVLVSPHVPNADGSSFFGSPTKLFEYMAMGKGIVASDLFQIGEVLRDSLRVDSLPSEEPIDSEARLSVLCRPGRAADLRHAIKFLVERPAWRRVLGQNARREALTKYTWKSHVHAILDGLKTFRVDR